MPGRFSTARIQATKRKWQQKKASEAKARWKFFNDAKASTDWPTKTSYRNNYKPSLLTEMRKREYETNKKIARLSATVRNLTKSENFAFGDGAQVTVPSFMFKPPTRSFAALVNKELRKNTAEKKTEEEDEMDAAADDENDEELDTVVDLIRNDAKRARAAAYNISEAEPSNKRTLVDNDEIVAQYT